MNLQYVPLLKVQRELQGMPLNMERFREYLRKLSPDGEHLEVPALGLMNPMAKEHVTALLDSLLGLDADGVAAKAAAEASAALPDTTGDFRIAVVVADDKKGGWTNRYDYEFGLRFGRFGLPFDRDAAAPSGVRPPRWLDNLWLTGVLWSSEPASVRAVREAILLPAHRAAYVLRNGPPATLRAMLAQEGHVMAAVGCAGPTLDADDLEYTREVLAPFLDTPADDKRTCIECLFGDEAGRTLGFTPRGLSHRAGLALALLDARAARSTRAPRGT